MLQEVRLGIDFGTTRIVAAAVDRGNYPVVTFEDAENAARDWFPPLIACQGPLRVYGWDAWAVQTEPGWTVIRSIKRTLEDSGSYTRILAGSEQVPLLTLLEELARSFRTALLERSNLRLEASGRLEIMLGVPANANSNQRYLTLEPFQRAGFHVLGLLNEPSAASIEYGHRDRNASLFERLLVYDLGGGTFDASLVSIEDKTHTVIASEGVTDVGGDDFDIVLAEMALNAAGIAPEDVTQGELFRLHEECRSKKEMLHPNTRRVVVDLGAIRSGLDEISISAAEYYDQCRPLVERTVEATERLLEQYGEGERLDALYVTGGGSELPIVVRRLRESFGRRVRRSAYTRSATAIGLAIQADEHAGYTLRESFSRNFGVWRESHEGRRVWLDVLFPKGTPLPQPGEAAVTIARRYQPVHNIGHFRYLECSHETDGHPTGDIALWDEILFPFDPAVADTEDLSTVSVEQTPSASEQRVEERYLCTSTGAVEVEISNLTAGYTRKYRLGRWAERDTAITPGRKKKRTARP